MKKIIAIMPFAFAMALLCAVPAMAQDVAKEAEATAAEAMESHNEMMGEGCQCPCMKEMHEKMMKEHGEHEGQAEGMAHAEGMASDEAHAGMMAAHKEMMADCKCMSGEKGEGEMSCKMHGEGKGEMKGEGMQHRHGAKADESKAEADAGS